MLGAPLFHRSGGLTYHLRALAHGRVLWRPYRAAVAGWLADWRPAADHLLLLGPSAGYSLERAFLARFRRVTVVEPDPLARRILAWRFRGIAMDAQAPGNDLLDPARRHPDAAALFCNLLGQDWLGAGDEAARAGRLEGLRRALAGHSWASYHDVVSTTVEPRAPGPIETDAVALEDLLRRFWAGGELPLVDHHTHVLGAGRPGRYVVWRLTRARYHLVGWTSSEARISDRGRDPPGPSPAVPAPVA